MHDIVHIVFYPPTCIYIPEEYFFLVGIGPEGICRGNHCVHTNVKFSAKQGERVCMCAQGRGRATPGWILLIIMYEPHIEI